MKKLLLVFLLALSACAGFKPWEYEGMNKKELLTTYGVPESRFVLDGTEVWEYYEIYHKAMPINGVLVGKTTRYVTRFILEDGLVVNAEYEKMR